MSALCSYGARTTLRATTNEKNVASQKKASSLFARTNSQHFLKQQQRRRRQRNDAFCVRAESSGEEERDRHRVVATTTERGGGASSSSGRRTSSQTTSDDNTKRTTIKKKKKNEIIPLFCRLAPDAKTNRRCTIGKRTRSCLQLWIKWASWKSPWSLRFTRESAVVTTGTGAPRAYRFGCTKLRAEKEKKGTRSCFTWTNLV